MTANPRRGVIEEYREWLPVPAGAPVITLGEGGTPLVRSKALSELSGATSTSSSKAPTRPHRSRTGG